MSYELLILRRAQKSLSSIEKNNYKYIRDAILKLAEEPRPVGCKKLVGRNGWRIRIGNYRVVYDIDDASEKIVVLDIGHRRDIYS